MCIQFTHTVLFFNLTLEKVKRLFNKKKFCQSEYNLVVIDIYSQPSVGIPTPNMDELKKKKNLSLNLISPVLVSRKISKLFYFDP